jgi:hypothetical protein
MAVIVSANEVAKTIDIAKANAAAAAKTAAAKMAKNKLKENQHPCCGCYKENSTDSRCCGLCYHCCPAANIDKEIDKKRCDCY